MFKQDDYLHETLKPFEGTSYGKLKVSHVGKDHMVVVNENGSNMVIPFHSIRCITISRDESEIAWISGADGNRIP